MIPRGQRDAKTPAAAAAARYQNERDDNADRSEKGKEREMDVFLPLRSGVIKYATGLSDVFIKLYSCPCLSKLLAGCSFIFGASLALSHFGSARPSTTTEVQTAENVFEREKKGNAMGLILRCRE